MKDTLKAIYEILDSKKAIDIRMLDVSHICSFTDCFVICSGANERHIQALADEVKEKLKKQKKVTPSHIEGRNNAEWILMDYFDMIVHIFSIEAREFYELEKLWADALKLQTTSLK